MSTSHTDGHIWLVLMAIVGVQLVFIILVVFFGKLFGAVRKTIKSRRFRRVLWIVLHSQLLHSFMVLLSSILVALFVNDISFIEQNEVPYPIMWTTPTSLAIYLIPATIVIPYWIWYIRSMGARLHLPDAEVQQFTVYLAHRIHEQLQSQFRPEERHPIRQDLASGGGTSDPTTGTPSSPILADATDQIQQDLASGGGASSAPTIGPTSSPTPADTTDQTQQDVASGGETPCPTIGPTLSPIPAHSTHQIGQDLGTSGGAPTRGATSSPILAEATDKNGQDLVPGGRAASLPAGATSSPITADATDGVTDKIQQDLVPDGEAPTPTRVATSSPIPADATNQIQQDLALGGETSAPTTSWAIPADATDQIGHDLVPGGGANSSPTLAYLTSGVGTSAPTRSNGRISIMVNLTVDIIRGEVSLDCLQRFEPHVVLPVGSKVLYKRFEINLQTPEELDDYISQIVDSMEIAHNGDENCYLQLGSYAVFKYTETGPRMIRLQEEWTPTIIHISRRWSLFEDFCDFHGKWIIRGLNLQGAILRAANVNETEDLKVTKYKRDHGVDMYICQEPQIILKSAPRFRKKVFISASNLKKVGGVSLKLQSEPKDVQKAYLISIVDIFVPGLWIMIASTSLSILGKFYSSKIRRNSFFKLSSILWALIPFLSQPNPTHHGITLETDTLGYPYEDGCYSGSIGFAASIQGLLSYPTTVGTLSLTTLKNHSTFLIEYSTASYAWREIWIHLWSGLEPYITIYLVYLCTVFFIFLLRLVPWGHFPP